MIHIVPTVPPEIDGLADYCYKLWQNWPEPRPSWTCVAAHLPSGAREFWPEIELREFRRSREGLKGILDEISDDVIILHYVGYAYHPKGVPWWLPGTLRDWKARTGGRYFVMFHELWAKGSPRGSAFYLSPLARRIAGQLARDCDGWVTSCSAAYRKLVVEARVSPASGRVLPIGPGVKPAEILADDSGARPTSGGLRVAVFGFAGTRLAALRKHRQLLTEAWRRGVLERVSLLGKSGVPPYAAELKCLQEAIAPGGGELWQSHHDLPERALSHLLQEHNCGLAANGPALLSKSSVYAALCAHDLVVICARDLPEHAGKAAGTLELPCLESDDQRPQLALDHLCDAGQMGLLREATRRAAQRSLSWKAIARGSAEVVPQGKRPAAAAASSPSPDALSVGVLVTNYNSWHLARQCIQANLAFHGSELSRIVLLDDASPTPPPFEADGYELICQDRNLGFAANLNRGVRMFDTEIVLIFDADARPLQPYLQELKQAFASDPRLAVLGFATRDEAGRPTPSWDKEPNLWSLVLGQALYARWQHLLERRESRICPWLCAFAVRREAFDQLGGFDQEFDLLDVDLDFGMRVHRSGWKLWSHPDLLAFHTGGGTPQLVSKRLLRFYANRWRTLRKHGKIKFPRLCRFVILLRLRLELGLFRLMGRRWFPDPEIRRDKVEGREAIIAYCQKHYI